MNASGRADLCFGRPRLLTLIFVVLDGTSFLILIAGRGFVDSGFFDGAVKAGNYLILVGLLLQLVLMWIFTGFVATFHIRLCRSRSIDLQNAEELKKIKRLMGLVYAAAQIIGGRALFRLTTTAMDPTGYMAKHEWTFYAFEGAQMAQVILFCLAWYFYGPLDEGPTSLDTISLTRSNNGATSSLTDTSLRPAAASNERM